jgi:hydrogenase maturation protease
MSAERLPWEELERPGPAVVAVNGGELRAGSRVRLCPRPGADVFDLALAGRTAVVESIEQDLEDQILLAVTVEDDPGRDLGERRQPGHRFFFSPGEVEPLGAGDEETPQATENRVLVAGIGNVFLGDDGFGVALVGRVAQRRLPPGVDVVDFGIRGMDLAWAMQDGYSAVVLLDATPRGEPPGTLYVIEPELDDAEPALETHAMDPARVLSLVRALGGTPPRTLVVGCEPETVPDPDDQQLLGELSEPVRAALDEGTRMVVSLLADLTATNEQEVTY